MKSFKRVVIGVKLDEEAEHLDFLRGLSFLKDADIYLVHTSRLTNFGLFPELKLGLFPSGESKVLLEQAVLAKLNQIKSHLVGPENLGKISSECLFYENPKKGFCQHVADVRADLVILMGEEKHMPFGSFMHYQLNHINVPVFILKPKKMI